MESKEKRESYQEYLDKVKELQNSEGWKITEIMEPLELTFHIFNMNRKALIASIQKFKEPESLILWDIRNNEEMDFYLKEVTRQLHNFVASAKTFIESTHNTVKKVYGENSAFECEYDANVAKHISLNPVVQFVHKLRDYILHKRIPFIVANLNFELSTSLKINLIDFRNDLKNPKERKNWNELSIQFINSEEEKTIEDLVKDYTKAIIDFHDWLYDRQLEIHKEAFDKAQELQLSIENSQWHIKIK